MAERRRIHRVGERIQAVIATAILRLSDPRFNLVTITSVVVSNDMRHAKVYFVVHGGPERVTEVEAAFEAARGLLRSVVAKELRTKISPELRFFYDDTLDTVENVERLFEKIRSEENGS